MKLIFAFLILLIITIFILVYIKSTKLCCYSKKITENFLRPGKPSIPMNIPIPENVRQSPGYIDYSYIDFKNLCPTPSDKTVWCKDHSDCPGKAELCYNSAGYPVISNSIGLQEESNYCVCSIQNPCMSEAIC
jgi:hypothetical protein